jgi:hypothetical protein
MTEPMNNLLFVCEACEARTVGRDWRSLSTNEYLGEFISEDGIDKTCPINGSFHCWRRREVLDELIYLRRTLAAVVKHLGIEVK